MRLYLEPSVLVKLFKREHDSAKMLDVIEAIDSRTQWFAFFATHPRPLEILGS